MGKRAKRVTILFVAIMIIIGICGCEAQENSGGATMDLDQDNKQQSTQPEKETDQTIEIPLDGKKPEEFSLEDYNELSLEEKAVFPDCFDSMEQYKEWYSRVVEQATEEMPPVGEITVDLKGKKPQEFTLEDYRALKPEEKVFFPDCFSSMQEYYSWYNRVVGESDGT